MIMIGKRATRLTLALIIFLFCDFTVFAQNNWPAFHNSDQTNKSKETGLISKWPADGPELAYTISGIGEGYSSIIIADGLLYTAGTKDQQSYVYAFDTDGKQIWKQTNGKAWETTMSWAVSYTGTRSTPAYDNGIVYHLGEMGRLAAFEAKTGKEIWSLDIREQFDAPVPEYGYSESVLVDGDRLYCSPAGKKGFIICLEKKTGKVLWVNTSISGEAAYNSSVILESAGYRQIVSLSSDCIFAVDSRNGKQLWNMEFKNSHSLNCTDPVVYDHYVLASSGYGKGSIMINLNPEGNVFKPSLLWKTTYMDNPHGGVILHKDNLYGTGSDSRGFFCLDFMSGKQMWKAEGKGSVTYADGMLYLLEERGIMRLVKAIPEKYEPAGEFKVPSGGKGPYWAHPVVCGGRLYIRHTDKVFVYKIKT